MWEREHEAFFSLVFETRLSLGVCKNRGSDLLVGNDDLVLVRGVGVEVFEVGCGEELLGRIMPHQYHTPVCHL